MDNINEFSEDELCKEVSKDGVKLKVISTMITEGEWQLQVLNEKGISSNWMESFSTAQLAIEAGVEAIEKEGVQEFASVEGFEYLNE